MTLVLLLLFLQALRQRFFVKGVFFFLFWNQRRIIGIFILKQNEPLLSKNHATELDLHPVLELKWLVPLASTDWLPFLFNQLLNGC